MSEPWTASGIRLGYVPPEAQCWNFFRYHLLLQAHSLAVTIVDRPVSTLREQIAAIDALLRQGIDVLLLRPLLADDAELLAVLQRARQSGVPVIALDGALDGVEVSSVSVDNRAAQAAVVEHVCRRLGGRGRLAHLQGNQGMAAGYLRTRGLYDMLERYPDVELVHVEDIDWSSPVPLRTQGAACARRALAAHPELDAVITTSDEAAFGVADVVSELGLRDRVLITGFDALPDALIAIDDGLLEASVYQPQQAMAQCALREALRLAGEVDAAVAHVQLPGQIVARHNLVEATAGALELFPDVLAELEQQRRAEQQSTTFLATLIDNLPSRLIVIEAQTHGIVLCNRPAEQWFGVGPGELRGRTVFDTMPPEAAAAVWAQDSQLLQTGEAMTTVQEDRSFPARGRQVLRLHKVPVLDDQGVPAYLLVIAEDISAQCFAEEAAAERARELEASVDALRNNREMLVAAEKMAALGSLVAGVAHELATPIGNGLIVATTLMERVRELSARLPAGLSRTMLDDYLAEAEQSAQILERNLQRAAELINSFRQISVDQSSSQRRSFVLSRVVAEVLMTLSPMIRRTPFVLSQDIPEQIVMDSYPGALEQVLINLINNAIIHGLAGRQHGKIAISARALGEDSVELVVEDDGCGIDNDLIGRVFLPFITTRCGEGGSGLGLSIVHSIVSGMLGGEISLASTPGSGTRFCLTLPCSVATP